MPPTSAEILDLVVAKLDEAYCLAEGAFVEGGEPRQNLNSRFKDALLAMSNASSSASTGFTNVVTGLAIKAAAPEIDVRYHQVQIQEPQLFNFRRISEKAVYPWLSKKRFEGAKSGWQTRTFERPKPYMLDYGENIGTIKQPFLICYDEIETKGSSSLGGLVLLIYHQILLREEKSVPLAEPNISEISTIVSYLTEHFFRTYTSKGASRLPVLALYAVYSVMMKETARYEGRLLKPLHAHSAADSQTGALGDIEVLSSDSNVFEALEVKHGRKITEEIVRECLDKILPHRLNRYYILTTHPECRPNESMDRLTKEILDRIGCQVIVNGVIPSLQYYLRLLSHPQDIFTPYAKLLQSDEAISHEHKVAWNSIVLGRKD